MCSSQYWLNKLEYTRCEGGGGGRGGGGGGKRRVRVYTKHTIVEVFRKFCEFSCYFRQLRYVRLLFRRITFKRVVGSTQLLAKSEELVDVQRTVVETGTGRAKQSED